MHCAFLGDHHLIDEDSKAQRDSMTCPRSLKIAWQSKNAKPVILPPGPVLCEFPNGLISVLILPASPFPGPYTSVAINPREISSTIPSLESQENPSTVPPPRDMTREESWLGRNGNFL